MKRPLIFIIFILMIANLSISLRDQNHREDEEDLLERSINLLSIKHNLKKNAKLITQSSRNHLYNSAELNDILSNFDCKLQNEQDRLDQTSDTLLQDFHIGLKNCHKMLKDKKIFPLESSELLVRTKKLMTDYFSLLHDQEYRNGANHQQSFTFLFTKNFDLLIRSKSSPLYPLISYILGDLAMKSFNRDLFMVGPIILTELITERHYKKELEQLAWISLHDGIRFSFTGSSGDNTPISWKNLLNNMAYMIVSKS